MQNNAAIEGYESKSIEEKWLKKWKEDGINNLKDPSRKNKFYCLEMFPYPSGEPHMGHARNYTIGDVMARVKSRQGFNVLHPMGYDAFGLPAENAAIKSGIHPKKSTFTNIRKMEEALMKMAMTYNFEEQVITCEPEYYKWTQWFFLLLFKMGLAEKKEGLVNWCSSCQTVLANEQVIDGKCERCDSEIIRKNLSQWYFKITDYAQALLDDMELLKGWPEKVLTIQRNWIGRSEGARINFKLDDEAEEINIPVFTTRPDTIFGTTFFILSPEHPLVEKIVIDENIKKEINRLKTLISKQSDIERGSAVTEKIGGFTGRYVINPVSGEKVPVWIANYVLSDYGTGAIMAVPAHDDRDFEFAKKYDIPIREVISPTGKISQEIKEVYTGHGKMVNSAQFSGLDSEEGKKNIIEYISEKNLGSAEINFKLKNWLISRQRYWGAPIPIIYCEKCGMVPVPEKELPVILPEDVDFKPTGLSPLSYSDKFVNVNCPVCGNPAKRETDTMDTFVCSSWYFLRYCSPSYDKEAFKKDDAHYWMPVDQYIGGIEHATMHLIYSRFFTKVLYDAGLIDFKEPFTSYYPHGVVTLGGQKMSKSKGNIINPSEIYNKYGSDTLRLYILFIGPSDSMVDWSDKGVEGSYRFLSRFYRIIMHNIKRLEKNGFLKADNNKRQNQVEIDPNTLDGPSKELARKLHQTIKKVTDDIFRFNYNTAISAVMELLNSINKYNSIKKADDFNSGLLFETSKKILQLISPITPFIAEELWEKLGMEYSIHKSTWPEYKPEFAKEEKVTIVFQVNGKIREKQEFQLDCSEEEVNNYAFSSPRILENIKDKKIIKKIFVKNKLYNIVIN
ncbi:MAG: leucine--tRNA ligase [Actinomycetota bacterium]|nr:leucine--tRNA ligase [Actinomycetota bacterium]